MSGQSSQGKQSRRSVKSWRGLSGWSARDCDFFGKVCECIINVIDFADLEKEKEYTQALKKCDELLLSRFGAARNYVKCILFCVVMKNYYYLLEEPSKFVDLVWDPMNKQVREVLRVHPSKPNRVVFGSFWSYMTDRKDYSDPMLLEELLVDIANLP